MPNAILHLDHITKYFEQATGRLDVLRDVTYAFEQGKSYAIVGVSGTGKSTLIHVLAGIERPSAGHVLLNKTDLYVLRNYQQQFLRNTIGLVFQEPCLLNELTVLENVMLKGLIDGMNKHEAQTHAMSLLLCIGLQDKAYVMPAVLSGGQQQRVAILRAIFNKPLFLLADEPTGNLDEQTGHVITELLHTCKQEWGMGLIVSTHDMYVAQSMEHILQLKDGHLITD